MPNRACSNLCSSAKAVFGMGSELLASCQMCGQVEWRLVRQDTSLHSKLEAGIEAEPIAFDCIVHIEVVNPARVEIEVAFANLG